MSEEYQKYEVDEPVIYTNGTKVELGIVKKVCGDDEYFVNYHTGDTAARTHARHLSKISNRYAYHIFRLDPDGKERKKIVGTTTVDKAFERFMLDACPEVKKKLKALEIIETKKVDVDTLMFYTKQHSLNDEWALQSYNEWVAGNEINLRKRILAKDEFDLLKEVMK